MPTFGGHVSPGERLRRLSPHECEAWLCSHHEGQVGISSLAAGIARSLSPTPSPEIRSWCGCPTTTTSCTMRLVLRSASTSTVERSPPIAKQSWSTGTAALGGERPTPADRSGGISKRTGLPDVRTSVICLPLNAVEGFELRDR